MLKVETIIVNKFKQFNKLFLLKKLFIKVLVSKIMEAIIIHIKSIIIEIIPEYFL